VTTHPQDHPPGEACTSSSVKISRESVNQQTPALADDSIPPSTKPPSSHTSREFRRLIEAFHDGVLVTTRQGIVYGNQALITLLGYPSLHEFLTTSPKELIRRHVPRADRGRAVHLLSNVLRSLPLHAQTELPLIGLDKSESVVLLYVDSIEFEGVPAVLVTMRDITESRSIQEKLSRAERMASIGTLAAGVAHEINNPLAYVTTNIAYCMERLRYMEELLEGKSIRLGNPASLRAMLTPMAQALTEAHHGTGRVATIVRDLRALTRDDKELDSSVDLPSSLSTAIHMSDSEVRYRSRLTTDIDNAGAVWGNETRLVQIFLNLIVNAAQSFKSDNTEQNLIEISSWAEGDTSVTEITDNGRGIPDENIQRIFDPFFTTKPVGVGTGLGLSICHGLVESMSGSLTVRSEYGVGSTFRLELRTSSEKPQSIRRIPSVNPNIRARVLIVDDEPLILRSIARLLRDQHDVETAINGREALEKLHDEGPFDLIVCDLMMPEMTGMELHTAVAATDPETAARFVFLTGGAFTEQARAFLNRVDNPKLDKPIQPNLLRNVVSGVLRG